MLELTCIFANANARPRYVYNVITRPLPELMCHAKHITAEWYVEWFSEYFGHDEWVVSLFFASHDRKKTVDNDLWFKVVDNIIGGGGVKQNYENLSKT